MSTTYPYRRADTQSAANSHYYTVPEAARKLRVDPSTVWRWIEKGKLRAYRVGPKAIRIKPQDLEAVIEPVTETRKGVKNMQQGREHGAILTRPQARRLTEEEVRRGLAALAQLRELRATISARHQGKVFLSAEELIREEREERSKRL